ncbi:type I-E CRISPR-associated protein Cas7/Cse4/CasC [Rothia halotolerans]|jgi:CRISPR system Cascade subunit CasC|uniref:type I-E CRISPR-associated protein Cas7/Cse4/CasC n=1 Tax=Rothia halotolerans TaxID=405770 RepID=UPI00101C76AC|nr:type I-E CRISPR-associated protein Cas7/Cse4/CasC [Rothia halotolerans]
MARHLTISLVTVVPYSNLNRDDGGVPKRVMQGGALRALHSSQSIKRGIRTAYENASLEDRSIRSGKIAAEVADIALTIDPAADKTAVEKQAKKIIGALTKNESTDDGADRSTWLSSEEITTAAQAALDASDKPSADFVQPGRSGSLAIAAFGRMFAAAPEKGTEAALSVSPGVTTHRVSIDTDYFSTVDDVKERERQTGATFLGVSQYVNGVFYRTVTIDKEQLKESWSGFDLPDAEERLGELITAILYGLPRGKEHSSAPYVQPALVLAEEQRYRTAYDFETPVQNAEEGGYLETTIDRLGEQYAQARSFDPGNFGPTEALTGTYAGLEGRFGELTPVDKDAFVQRVVGWIRK